MSELPGAGDFPGLSWGELPALGRPVLKHFTKGPALLLLLPVARIGAVLEEAQGPVAVAGSCLARAGCPSCPSSSLAVRPRTPPAPPHLHQGCGPPFYRVLPVAEDRAPAGNCPPGATNFPTHQVFRGTSTGSPGESQAGQGAACNHESPCYLPPPPNLPQLSSCCFT